jgi:hypothetical protein
MKPWGWNNGSSNGGGGSPAPGYLPDYNFTISGVQANTAYFFLLGSSSAGFESYASRFKVPASKWKMEFWAGAAPPNYVVIGSGNGSIKYTASQLGVTIAHVVDGPDVATTTVTVNVKAITVHLASDADSLPTATPVDVIPIVEADGGAMALLSSVALPDFTDGSSACGIDSKTIGDEVRVSFQYSATPFSGYAEQVSSRVTIDMSYTPQTIAQGAEVTLASAGFIMPRIYYTARSGSFGFFQQLYTRLSRTA